MASEASHTWIRMVHFVYLVIFITLQRSENMEKARRTDLLLKSNKVVKFFQLRQGFEKGELKVARPYTG